MDPAIELRPAAAPAAAAPTGPERTVASSRRAALRPAAAALLLSCSGCVEPTQVERSWTAFGTHAAALVRTTGPDDAGELVDEIRETMRRVETALDANDPDSRIGALNREAAAEPYRLEDRDVDYGVALALDYARATEGAYDPTVGPLLRLYREAGPGGPDPAAVERSLAGVGWHKVLRMPEARAVRFRERGMGLELYGVARGLAIDVAARRFARAGTLAGLLRIGDAYYAWNRPGQGGPWTLLLEDPRAEGRWLAELQVEGRGVSVCGRGAVETGAPLLDPATGRPPESDVLVAVAVADGAADAEAISRALVVSGSASAGALLGKLNRVEAVLVVAAPSGATVLASASLSGRLSLADELALEADGPVRYLLPPSAL